MDYLVEIAALRAEIASLRSMIESYVSEENEGGGNSIDDIFLRMDADGGRNGGQSGAFQWDGETITQCYFQFGRAVYGIADQQASGDGTYYLSIPHDTPLNATVTTTQGSNDLTKTVIPLFKVEGGEITKDYRGMPVVPVRE